MHGNYPREAFGNTDTDANVSSVGCQQCMSWTMHMRLHYLSAYTDSELQWSQEIHSW